MNLPTTRVPPKPRKAPHTAQLSGWKHLLLLLYESPRTLPELAELTGLQNSTISRWMARLHTRPNLVYICEWRRISARGNYSSVWKAGYLQPDAPKPMPKTSSYYNKEWRKKKLKESLTTQPQPGVIRHVSTN